MGMELTNDQILFLLAFFGPALLIIWYLLEG